MAEPKKKLQTEAYNIRFPKNTLLNFRVIEAKKQQSKQNNPQHVLTLEVINSAPFDVDGENIDINGLEFMSFSTLTSKALEFANRVRRAFGFNDLTEQDIDSADPKEYIGQVCWAIVESTEEDRINELTKEPVIDPYTGRPMKTYQRRIVEWVPKPKENE